MGRFVNLTFLSCVAWRSAPTNQRRRFHTTYSGWGVILVPGVIDKSFIISLLFPVKTNPTCAAKMVRKLKFHEKKLLKKVDFISWNVDNNIHELKVMKKYFIQRREDYTK